MTNRQPLFRYKEDDFRSGGGRFPWAWLQPIEQQRVRFAVFLRTLRKLRHLPRCSQHYAFGRKSRSL